MIAECGAQTQGAKVDAAVQRGDVARAKAMISFSEEKKQKTFMSAPADEYGPWLQGVAGFVFPSFARRSPYAHR
jgi:hypothetical protein